MDEQEKCYLCDKTVSNPDEARCYGCGEFICEDCDENPNVPFGSHEPFDHEPNEDDE